MPMVSITKSTHYCLKANPCKNRTNPRNKGGQANHLGGASRLVWPFQLLDEETWDVFCHVEAWNAGTELLEVLALPVW